MNQQERHEQAKEIYRAGMERVLRHPRPPGQKFLSGTRVRIANDLGSSMAHFPGSGCNATVLYTHAHAYGAGGADNDKCYCLDIDGIGQVSWYYEHQLTPIEDGADKP